MREKKLEMNQQKKKRKKKKKEVEILACVHWK